MELIAIGIFCLVFTFFMFPVYLAIMNLKRNKDKMSIVAKCLAYPWLWIGLIMDMCYNFTVGTILFLEPPREILMTTRLNRHLAVGVDWRRHIAKWFCANLLDPFDPAGRHCG